jgi:phosphate transport system substrate-binding protein
VRNSRHAHRSWLRAARALCLALIAAAAAGVSCAEEIRIGGTGASLGTVRLLAEAFRKSNPDIAVLMLPNLGSTGGIKAAIQGAADIGLSSRPLRDAERSAGASEIEYGRTPFVFAVSVRSSTNAVTLVEVVDMYAGKTRTWPDGTPVRLVLRPDSDADTEYTAKISQSMQAALRQAHKRPGVIVSITDQDAADDLEKTPGALGTTSLAVILSEGRALRPLKLDGVEPTVRALSSGAYPYYKLLYFVTGARPSAAAQRFIAFARSGAGRRILARTGHWVPPAGR